MSGLSLGLLTFIQSIAMTRHQFSRSTTSPAEDEKENSELHILSVLMIMCYRAWNDHTQWLHVKYMGENT